jgi:hypothetical protein
MRLVVVAISAAVLVLPASATVVDPRALVLRNSDVPNGFAVDRENSRATTNGYYVRNGLGKLVARTGRITGYRRLFRHRDSRVKVVQAGVDVFRTPDGAQQMLARHDAEQRRHNAKRGLIKSYGRESARIGPSSWVYWSGYPGYYVLVVWSTGRALGYVTSWELGKRATLSLARTQQRRMAASIR